VKVAILAGGLGSRLSEETTTRPKPLVDIGGRPILWHILRSFAQHGFIDFVLAVGHQGRAIADYLTASAMPEAVRRRQTTTTVRLTDVEGPAWTVEVVDTGPDTQTGGRIKRLAPHLGEQTFMLTWSDGLSDIDLRALEAFHRSHGKLATVSAVHPPPRFGHLELDGDRVVAFREKPPQPTVWINGGFFVLEPQAIEYIDGDSTQWERAPMERLASDGQLMAYRHAGFWHCMDTVADKRILEELWRTNRAPWKQWE
jgi:glucose-1-phosphate cytidylyltransferase